MKTFTRIGTSVVALAVCFSVVGCGGVGIANAGVPAINQIIPQAVTAGSGSTTVEIVGSRINNSTVVLWNGTPLSTTMLDNSTVASPVESANLATPGVAHVQLMNTVTGVKSDAVDLSIASANSKSAPLIITTTSLPNGTVGTAYSATLTGSGGNQPYSWSFTSGKMPAGLSLKSNGVISGTPTTAGTYSLGLTLKDKSKPPQQMFIAFTLIISKAASTAPQPTPLTVSTSSLPSATFGTAYSQILSAAGGSPAYTWSISSGSLPPGLSLAPSGAISGTPTQGGAFSFNVTVNDSAIPQQSQTVALSITVNQTPITIKTTSLAAGTSGAAYSQILSASGGTPAYSWSISSGSLPAGLSLASSGVISGTPTASGTATFVAIVHDSGNPVQTQSATLSISVAPPQLKVTTTSFAQGTSGQPYSGTLQATGGTPSYRWSIASGNLPAGLALNNTTGAISGTPISSGTAAFTAAVTDTSNQTASALVTINVTAPRLAITALTPASATTGTPYSQPLLATGGTAPYQWSITAGQLPAGLILSPTSGIISGTPTASGTASFTATVTDSSNPVQTASLSTSLVVNAAQSPLVKPLAVVVPGALSGTVGSSYSVTLSATGGTGPYVWSISSGTLPAGLKLSTAGILSGTPTQGANGTYNFAVTATDAETPAQTASANVTMTIGAAASPLAIASSSLASGSTGTAYNQSLQATGGTPAYIWSVTSGSLPPGLTMSSAGVISGTPSTSGRSTFTASVNDSGSPLQTQSVTTSIAIAAPQIASAGTTWFVRADGGTRYSANVPNGQCNGKADAPYPGSGVNQNCAFNDFRYMWDDGSLGSWGWVMAGGDTVVVEGCAAGAGQMNPDAPHCRIGWDNNTSNGTSNPWCWYAPSQYGYGMNTGCYNPPIPAGTASQHTRILGGCAYTSSCNPVNTYPYTSNLTQIFGGFGTQITLNLAGTQYVDVEGLEITSHNGKCVSFGSPVYPKGCTASVPGTDDFSNNGIKTDNTTANVTLQDVYVHGFTASGIYGPIGGPITMTRVFVGFNGFAGWNFNDPGDTPNAAGSSIAASYVTMEGNGCNEQYPIANPQFSAMSCYDDSSNGFGDSWSGQDTTMASFTCDHCTQIYNTKDGFIGPHAVIGYLKITNSTSYGNMGQQWKWTTGTNSTTIFENNITVGNCTRMSQQLPGAAQNFALSTHQNGSYLSDFCRAAGDMFSLNTNANSTVLIAGNTEIGYNPTIFDLHCGTAGACGSSPWVFQDNITLGYSTSTAYYPYSGESPGMYYLADNSIQVAATYNVEYGTRNGDCSAGSAGNICSDPLLVGEPAQGAWPLQTILDISSFSPSASSPAIGAGTIINGLTTDYYGTARQIPPSIGAVQP